MLDQGVFRLGQDPDEVLFPEGIEFHPDGKPALEFGDEIRGFGYVKGPGCNEENVVRSDHPVLGHHGGPLYDGEDVSLDPLPRDIGAVSRFTARDLVDLIDEDDPRLFHPLDRLPDHGIHVDELLGLFLGQEAQGLRDFDFPLLFLFREEPPKHLLDVDIHLLHS